MKKVSPETVGMNAAGLDRIGAHLRSRYVDPGKVAGTATLVARRGRICYLETEGVRDMERQTPMALDTIFRIYSMTKPITSIALMQLFEQGKISLTDPVEKFIPRFAGLQVWKSGAYPLFETVPSARPMQIRDLLTHMSGLTYDFMQQNNVDAAYGRSRIAHPKTGYTLDQMIDELAELPLVFSPGERWNYSVATDVVGHIVEVISGKSLKDYFQDHILGPLGMVDTAFEIAPDKHDRFAACYERRPDKSVRLQDDPHKSTYQDRTFWSGGGGLVSTLSDYYRFCQMLLNGGTQDGARIIGPRTLSFMRKNHLPGGVDLSQIAVGSFSESVYEGTGFGLGFGVKVNPVQNGLMGSEGIYFWGGMASTIFWIDPVEDMIVIFMTQLIPSGTYDFRGQLESIIYGAIDD
ncbi:serine hydrolase domain-containing protein [Kordiimonas sediminis]|uniref:serine hydrolase domain-containing protein n=1 Tax=Kordiimonas sediminis TaxID=1735581 RepID=UPI001E3904E1|nr:serine hydrolase [Kordiimonas sediminis]